MSARPAVAVCCAHCGRPYADEVPVEPSNDALDVMRLRKDCDRRGVRVSGNGSVGTAGAAVLLNRAPKTVRAWREQGLGPPYRKGSGKSDHVEYMLVDLAAYLSKNLHEPGE